MRVRRRFDHRYGGAARSWPDTDTVLGPEPVVAHEAPRRETLQVRRDGDTGDNLTPVMRRRTFGFSLLARCRDRATLDREDLQIALPDGDFLLFSGNPWLRLGAGAPLSRELSE